MALSLPTVEDSRVQQALNAIAGSFPLTTQLLVDEVITVQKIVQGTITGDRIAAGTITGDLVAAGTIEGTNIKGATITGSLIAGEVIEGAHIKAGTITAAQIEAGSITAVELDVSELSAISADLGTITAGSIDSATVTGTTITGGTIRTAAAGARVEIDSSGIRGINASAVEKFNFDTASGILTAKAVISSEAGSAIDTEHLAGQITETQIEDDSISTPKLQANSVTAAEIDVAELSAITADLGTITAGTITGAVFRTSSSNPKVQMDSEGFKAYDSEGTVLIDIPANGSTADFAGHLAASGLDFEALASGESINRIIWLRPGTETTVAYIQGYESGPVGERDAALSLNAGSHSQLRLHSRFSASEWDEVEVAAGGNSVPLLRRKGGAGALESGFLRLATTGDRVVAFGTTTINFPNSQGATSKTVAHGLGRTPVAVVATSNIDANCVSTLSFNSTNFTLDAFNAFGVRNGNDTVTWIAIG